MSFFTCCRSNQVAPSPSLTSIRSIPIPVSSTVEPTGISSTIPSNIRPAPVISNRLTPASSTVESTPTPSRRSTPVPLNLRQTLVISAIRSTPASSTVDSTFPLPILKSTVISIVSPSNLSPLPLVSKEKPKITGPLDKLPLVLHQLLFTFQGCTTILNHVCVYWNQVRKDVIQNPNYQFLHYKSLCLTRPLFRAILNITANQSYFGIFVRKVNQSFHLISSSDKKERENFLSKKEENKIDTNENLSIEDHVTRINSCFELLIQHLPSSDSFWKLNLRKMNYTHRWLLIGNKLEKLNRIVVLCGLVDSGLVEKGLLGSEIGFVTFNQNLRFSMSTTGFDELLKQLNDRFFKPFKTLSTYRSSLTEARSDDSLIKKFKRRVSSISIPCSSYFEFEQRILNDIKGFTTIKPIIGFPSDILGKFVCLETLDLSHQQLLEFPDCTALTKLKKIVLDNNFITEVPEHVIVSLKQIEEIFLRNNFIRSISNKLAAIPSLSIINIEGNPFADSVEFIEFQTIFNEKCLRMKDSALITDTGRVANEDDYIPTLQV